MVGEDIEKRLVALMMETVSLLAEDIPTRPQQPIPPPRRRGRIPAPASRPGRQVQGTSTLQLIILPPRPSQRPTEADRGRVERGLDLLRSERERDDGWSR